MASKEVPSFDVEGENAIFSDTDENSDYDSSSDYVHSGAESSDDSDNASESRRQRQRRHHLRRDKTGRFREKSWKGELIYGDPGEELETFWFGKRCPELCKLNIPAARREAIMVAKRNERRLAPKAREIRNQSLGPKSSSIPPTASASYDPARCFLMRLPPEVQLQILSYCLMTDAPFIDFCYGYRFAASGISTERHPGQNNVSLAVLATNQHFRTLGFQVLWQENRFLYTRSDEYTLLNTDILMKLPQVTLLRHLTIHQDCIWQTSPFYNRVMLDTVLFAISITEQFPALHSLQIDLATTEIRPYYREFRKRLGNILLEAQYFLRDIRRGRSLRALSNISVTGVSDDDLGCLAVKLISSIQASGGVLNVGVAGWGGYLISLVVVPEESERVMMALDDVDAWVDWRRTEHKSQRGKYQRTMLEWEKFFPVEMTN